MSHIKEIDSFVAENEEKLGRVIAYSVDPATWWDQKNISVDLNPPFALCYNKKTLSFFLIEFESNVVLTEVVRKEARKYFLRATAKTAELNDVFDEPQPGDSIGLNGKSFFEIINYIEKYRHVLGNLIAYTQGPANMRACNLFDCHYAVYFNEEEHRLWFVVDGGYSFHVFSEIHTSTELQETWLRDSLVWLRPCPELPKLEDVPF